MRRASFAAVAAVAVLAGAPRPALAEPAEAADPSAAFRIAPSRADGYQVSRVYVHLRNPSGDAAADEKTRTAIADAFGIRPGGGYLQFRTDVAAAQVRRLPFVKDVEVRLYSTSGGGEVTIDVSPQLLRRQLTLIASWTFSTVIQADCAEFCVERKVDVDRLFTHRWSLDRAEEAYTLFDRQADGKGVFLI